MAFQVRANRIQAGGYSLSYGKGNKKLTSRMAKRVDGWLYETSSSIKGPFPTARECKIAWGVWAEAKYKNGSSNAEGETDLSTSKPPPPLYTPKAPPSYTPQPTHGPTPLEVLTEVSLWYDRYKDRIEKINDKLAEQRPPHYNPFDLLRDSIEECLNREEARHDNG